MAQIVTTHDGSNTIFSEKFKDHYHSSFGAIQESEFIYIQNGLNYCKKNPLKIFEVGFGTGLNAILTFKEGLKKNTKIDYHTIELYPIDIKTINKLNYFDYLSKDQKEIYIKFHETPWNEEIQISDNFIFKKINTDFNTFTFDQEFDIIFFDAFAPEKQTSMWSAKNFLNIFNNLNDNGILVTYSSKGIVKNNLREAGFKVNRLNGPQGKRHILRAQKLNI